MVWPITSRGTPSSGEHVRSTHRVSQRRDGNHCSLAYSALASFRMGMSASASFQRRQTGNELLRQPDFAHQLSKPRVGVQGVELEISLQTQQIEIALLIGSVEPFEGPIFVVQLGVEGCERVRRRVANLALWYWSA